MTDRLAAPWANLGSLGRARRLGLLALLEAGCAGAHEPVAVPQGNIGFPAQVGPFYLATPAVQQLGGGISAIYATDDSVYQAYVNVHAPLAKVGDPTKVLRSEWRAVGELLGPFAGPDGIRGLGPPASSLLGSTVGDSSRYYPGLRHRSEIKSKGSWVPTEILVVYMGSRSVTIAVSRFGEPSAPDQIGTFVGRFLLAHAIGSKVPPL
jgi:hypothetical protein